MVKSSPPVTEEEKKAMAVVGTALVTLGLGLAFAPDLTIRLLQIAAKGLSQPALPPKK